ncbi:MAG: hypothetical protein V3V31_00660 [Methylococcales bacterium]
MYRKHKFSIILIFFVVLSGCAGVRPRPAAKSYEESGCRTLFNELDEIIEQAKTSDSQAARIEHFPNLRIDRFLASFRDNIADREAFQFWYGQLQLLDSQARLLEIKNTPKSLLVRLANNLEDPDELANELEKCSSILRKTDLNSQNRATKLIEKAKVLDDYSNLKRVLGFYYLTRFFVSAGIAELNYSVAKRFQQSLESIPKKGKWVYFTPPKRIDPISSEEIRLILQKTSMNPLRIPLLSELQKEKIFRKYAPIWEIDIATDEDRIGTPYWSTLDASAIDTSKPRTYKHLSYSRFNDDILLQLNYVIWFPSRPVTGVFDLFGGHLDGITWRVTLGTDGHPVFYDSIHNCGCYHMFFPGRGIQLRQQTEQTEEPIRSIDAEIDEETLVVLRIASGTHYIQKVYSRRSILNGNSYSLAEYDELRSISYPDEDVHRSMFGTDSLVSGTTRKERWILWPMGILSPGAMRQWGHHATAFVGRRHFDSTDLFDRYFVKTD